MVGRELTEMFPRIPRQAGEVQREEGGDGSVRVLDWGTAPSRAAAAAPDDMEE